MKIGLEMYFQEVIGHAADYDEVGLGIDAMLGHDVVRFLAANHKNCKPLSQCIVSFKQNDIRTLDEHELAMV